MGISGIISYALVVGVNGTLRGKRDTKEQWHPVVCLRKCCFCFSVALSAGMILVLVNMNMKKVMWNEN